MRHAFTMIELVFVIVILSIVAGISTDVIRNVYVGYIQQQTASDMHLRSNLAVTQITRLLERAIFPSVINGAGKAIMTQNTQTTVTGLSWIAKDIESFQGLWGASGRNEPGYSAFVDLNQSAGASIFTPGGNPTTIQTMLTSLTGLANWKQAALYFLHGYDHLNVNDAFWKFDAVENGRPYALFPLENYTDNTMTLTKSPANVDLADPNLKLPIAEYYVLTHTAMALVLNGGTLTLVQNFQPWLGETAANGVSSILATDVSTFEVWSENSGGMIRFRLCLKDKSEEFTPICKESGVLR